MSRISDKEGSLQSRGYSMVRPSLELGILPKYQAIIDLESSSVGVYSSKKDENSNWLQRKLIAK